MKKVFLVSVVLILLLCNITFALEDPFKITVTYDSKVIHPGFPMKYSVIVESTSNIPKAKVYVFGDYLSWITLEKSIINFVNKEATFEFYLTPTYDSREYTYYYQIKICALDDSNNVDTSLCSEKSVPITVRDISYLKNPVFKPIKEIYDPNEDKKVIIILNNTGTTDIENYIFEIIVEQDEKIKSKNITLPLITRGEEKTIYEVLPLDKYSDKGIYKITGKLYTDENELSSIKISSIKINEKSVIEKERIVNPGIFKTTVDLITKNEGNQKGEVSLEERLKVPLWLNSIKENTVKITEEEGYYKWSCILEGGEICKLSYTINYWLIYLSIIIMIGIVSLLIYEIEKPYIKKRIIKKIDEHIIHIEIKNKSNKILYKVEVHDILPRAFKLVTDFHTIKPNIIKKKNTYSELVWKIGKLEPKEERVLTYKIKQKLEASGGIVLPKAKITAISKDGKKLSISSKKLLVE